MTLCIIVLDNGDKSKKLKRLADFKEIIKLCECLMCIFRCALTFSTVHFKELYLNVYFFRRLHAKVYQAAPNLSTTQEKVIVFDVEKRFVPCSSTSRATCKSVRIQDSLSWNRCNSFFIIY